MEKPTIRRNKTEPPLYPANDDDDDVLEELPQVESKPTIVFDGSKSTSTAESLVDFLQGFNWQTSQLKDVPGIGPASVEKLKGAGISTVQQLLGLYMGFVEPKATSNEVNNGFFNKFKEISPKANAHTVTFAIAHLADRFGMVLYED